MRQAFEGCFAHHLWQTLTSVDRICSFVLAKFLPICSFKFALQGQCSGYQHYHLHAYIGWLRRILRSACALHSLDCVAIMANMKVLSSNCLKPIIHVLQQPLSPEIQQNEIELMLFPYVHLI